MSFKKFLEKKVFTKLAYNKKNNLVETPSISIKDLGEWAWANEDIGYRNETQAVEDVISEHKGWKQKYHYQNGSSESQAGRLNRLGKLTIKQV